MQSFGLCRLVTVWKRASSFSEAVTASNINTYSEDGRIRLACVSNNKEENFCSSTSMLKCPRSREI
jgi:hypothetical protein